mgnify:CR=1 FL=1
MITKAELVGTEYLTSALVCSDCGKKKRARVLLKELEDTWIFCLKCSESIHCVVFEEGGDYKIKEINHGD